MVCLCDFMGLESSDLLNGCECVTMVPSVKTWVWVYTALLASAIAKTAINNHVVVQVKI